MQHDDPDQNSEEHKPKKGRQNELVKLQTQIAELTEALQRERADAVNVRRRADEERSKLGNFYKSLVVRELLPAIDNIERSLQHIPKDLADTDFAKGVQGVAKQFQQSLEKLGVERIATVGELFDPNVHEAISMEEGDGDTEIVVEELQSGYKIEDEVIRHAMVRVKLDKVKKAKE